MLWVKAFSLQTWHEISSTCVHICWLLMIQPAHKISESLISNKPLATAPGQHEPVFPLRLFPVPAPAVLYGWFIAPWLHWQSSSKHNKPFLSRDLHLQGWIITQSITDQPRLITRPSFGLITAFVTTSILSLTAWPFIHIYNITLAC